MDLVLAQSGSGGGGFFLNPALVKMIGTIIFIMLFALGSVVRKIKEQQAKAEQERARLRREEDALRTGRPDGDAPRPASPGMSPAATQQEARRRLQELAERRRRELAEMQKRTAAPAAPKPGAQAPARTIPPVITPPTTPGRSMPAPVAIERDVRRRREDDANRKAVREAAARRKPAEDAAVRAEAAEMERRRSLDVPPAEFPQAEQTTREGQPRAVRTGVPLRMGNMATPRTPAEWRRALLLGEILNPPLALRPPE